MVGAAIEGNAELISHMGECIRAEVFLKALEPPVNEPPRLRELTRGCVQVVFQGYEARSPKWREVPVKGFLCVLLECWSYWMCLKGV